MKHLLICTIARNARPHLDRWMNQVLQLFAICASHGWRTTVSVYANDSTDGTDEWVSNLPSNNLWAHSGWLQVLSHAEKLGTQQYPSVWSVDRLRNLAAARNRCLDIAGDLGRFDKVAYIEPDVTYDPGWCAELVLAAHPKAAGIEPDVYSGWSLRSETHPKESVFLYDDCATRAGPSDIRWDIGEANGTWRGRSLVPTPGITGIHANSLHRVWSTFNCFCVYNARPFAEGVRWDCWNHRLDTGQQSIGKHGELGQIGWLDADTACICEAFRARGHTNILLNTNCLIRHA